MDVSIRVTAAQVVYLQELVGSAAKRLEPRPLRLQSIVAKPIVRESPSGIQHCIDLEEPEARLLIRLLIADRVLAPSPDALANSRTILGTMEDDSADIFRWAVVEEFCKTADDFRTRMFAL